MTTGPSILAQAADGAADYGLTLGGWITMILSVGFVTLLLGWCIWRVLREPRAEQRIHSQFDIEPPDAREP